MAKPFGLDSSASAGSNNTSADEQILLSWYGGDESQKKAPAADNRYAQLSFDNSDPNAARQRALDEFLLSKRQAFRAARQNDEPETRDAGPTHTILTNLELTNNKKQEVAKQLNIAAVADTRDIGFASIRQLEGPQSTSSQWLAAHPDIAAQFQSECGLQIGSQPDGTVFEILTSPQGYRRMLTAKGPTTVEIIADPAGQELFKHSSRNNVQRALTA